MRFVFRCSATFLQQNWPFYGLTLLALVLVGSSASVSEAVGVESYLSLLAFIFAFLMGHALLPFPIWNPASLVRWISRESWHRAAAALTIAIGQPFLVALTIGLANWLTDDLIAAGQPASRNAMTLTFAGALFATELLTTDLVIRSRVRHADNHWVGLFLVRELTWTFAVIAIALLPSALNSSWPWNVFLGIVVPVIVVHGRYDFDRALLAEERGDVDWLSSSSMHDRAVSLHRMLRTSFDDVTLAKDGSSFLTLGDGRYARVWSPDSSSLQTLLVCVQSPIAVEVPPTPELYEWVGRTTSGYCFGAVVAGAVEGTSCTTVMVSAGLMGSSLDASALEIACRSVEASANELQQEILQSFGGSLPSPAPH